VVNWVTGIIGDDGVGGCGFSVHFIRKAVRCFCDGDVQEVDAVVGLFFECEIQLRLGY
jgi:hypothetical protein